MFIAHRTAARQGPAFPDGATRGQAARAMRDAARRSPHGGRCATPAASAALAKFSLAKFSLAKIALAKIPLASTALATIMLAALAAPALAQDAAWLFNPVDGNFNNPDNFAPTASRASAAGADAGTVTFGATTRAMLFFSAPSTTIGGFDFTAAAPAYSLDLSGNILNIVGAGVSQAAGVPAPTFLTSGGSLVIKAGTAGAATIVNSLRPGEVGQFGGIEFRPGTSAGTARISNLGSGATYFEGDSTAAAATIVNDGANRAIADPNFTAFTVFFGTSSAASATISAVNGGGIALEDEASGGTARLKASSGGFIDISGLGTDGSGNSATSTGSIEGDGAVYLGSKTLTVGLNDLSTTFSGVIQDGGLFGGSGGTLVKAGSGTLTLSGANTYSGGTRLLGGTVSVASDANLGDTSGTLAFGGGTLQTTGTFASSRAVTLGPGGGSIDTAANTTLTLAGQIQNAGGTGGGGLFKTGTGTLVLGAANTYTGATTINSGTLQVDGTIISDVTVNSTGRLAGSGRVANVSVGAGATLAPGSAIGIGTLSVSGAVPPGTAVGVQTVPGSVGSTSMSMTPASSPQPRGGTRVPVLHPGIGQVAPGGNVVFQPGSTFAVRLAPGNDNSDRLTVGGTATLNGASVSLSILGPNKEAAFAPATSYRILTAAGGVSGTFGSISNPFLLLSPALRYDANNVTLTLVANNATVRGLPSMVVPSMMAPAGVVSPAPSAVTTTQLPSSPGVTLPSPPPLAPSGPTFATLAATPNQRAVGTTLDGLPLLSSPLTLPLAFSTNAANVRFALDQLSGEVHASTAGVLLDDTRLVRDAILARLRQVSTVDLLSKGGPTTGAIGGADPALGLTLWTQALGSRADAQGDGNASSLTRSTAGVFGGADLALLDGTLRLGLAGGYTSTSIRTDHLRGSSDVDTGYAAAYLGARLGGFALRGGVTGGFSSIDTTRDLTVPGYAGRLSSGTDARTFQGFAEVGYGIDLGKVGSGTIALEPFAGIALARFDRDASTERGASIAGLSIRSDDQSVAFSTIGLRGAATFALGDGLTATPRVSAAYQHASGDIRPSADLAFLAGGTPFQVTGTPLTKDAFLFEAGVEFKLPNDAVRLTLDYSGRVGDQVEEHAIKGGLNVRF